MFIFSLINFYYFSFFWLLFSFFHSPHPFLLKKQDYKKKTGDTTVRFSCVSVNVMRTDTVFETYLPVNSAIVGVTFIVYVNDTAIVCFLFIFFFNSFIYFLSHLFSPSRN